MGKVIDLGRRISIPVAVILAFVLHAGFAAGAAKATMLVDILKWNRAVRAAIADKLTQEYEVTEEKPPEPPPPPEPEPEKEQPPPPVVKETPPEPQKEETPPPAPAQAAAVLTQDPKPDEPLDLTGDTMVNGNGDGTSFGAVSASGTGRNGVSARVAKVAGTPAGTGTAPVAAPPPPPGPDKSRKAGLDGSSDWNDCPFPAEADAEQIDEEYVVLSVAVGTDGRPTTVTVRQDPGHGFGRAAKLCAMRKTYKTAWDHDGNAIAGQTGDFRVHFSH
jgi:protein TonB